MFVVPPSLCGQLIPSPLLGLPPPYLQWQDVAKSSKPIVSAVTGFALGGGCELLMMTDVVIAGDNAKFAQPEITLSVIPGEWTDY